MPDTDPISDDTEDSSSAVEPVESEKSSSVDDPADSTGEAPTFRVFTTRLSGPGVLAGMFFFAFSLFESLLPRT